MATTYGPGTRLRRCTCIASVTVEDGEPEVRVELHDPECHVTTHTLEA